MTTLSRRLALVCGLLALCSCASSGGPEYRLLKLHYENASGEKGVTTFGYDENGVLDRAIWELLDGSRSSLNYYEHDERGNLIRKYREFSDALTSNEVYEYDDAGNLLKERFERSDGVSGTATYEYDNGRVVRADCRKFKGWFTGVITYVYDEDGKKIRGDIVQDRARTGTITYSYDERGLLAREHWDFSGQWSQTFVYEYDVSGPTPPAFYTSSNPFIFGRSRHRVVREYYDYSNETGGPSYYTYDSNGKLMNKRFERSDGFSTDTVYLYDHRGRLTRSYRKYSNGLSAVFAYEFDEDGNLTTRGFKRSDGVSGQERYVYDERGALVRADFENFDSWLTGSISFTHDTENRLASGEFKGQDGFDADILFEHDGVGDLVRILWEFSFGKTQTYTFEYESE